MHLVQLKKLFLKLSAFVELYLRQDWSLLPVPDFRTIAKGEVGDAAALGQLNFVVAAVLVTVLHSSGVEADRPNIGNGQKFVAGALDCLAGDKKAIVEQIQDWFLNALEPKAVASSNAANANYSPRKLSAAMLRPALPLIGTKLFEAHTEPPAPDQPTSPADSTSKTSDIHLSTINVASSLKDDFEWNSSLNDEHESLLKETDRLIISEGELDDLREALRLKDGELQMLQDANERLQLQLADEQRLNRLNMDRSVLLHDMEADLAQAQAQLRTAQNHLKVATEQLEREREERHAFLLNFDAERRLLEDKVAQLKTVLQEKEDEIASLLESLAAQKEASTAAAADADDLNKTKSDNYKLLECLKKARDHILKQSSLITHLQQAQLLERSEINSTLIDLGTAVQMQQFLASK